MTGVLTFVFALQMTCWLVYNLYDCPPAGVCSLVGPGVGQFEAPGYLIRTAWWIIEQLQNLPVSQTCPYTCYFQKPVIVHSHQFQIGLDQLCEGQVSISTSLFHPLFNYSFAIFSPCLGIFGFFLLVSMTSTQLKEQVACVTKINVVIKWSSQKNWQMKSDLFDHTVSQGSECPNSLDIVNNISNEAQCVWSLA